MRTGWLATAQRVPNTDLTIEGVPYQLGLTAADLSFRKAPGAVIG